MTSLAEKSVSGSDFRYRFVKWASPGGVEDQFFRYWNDQEAEKTKWCNVADGNFEKMEAHVSDLELVRDFDQCVDHVESKLGRRLGGCGIDIAAGTLWAAPHLFRRLSIEHLHFLEYSYHRLVKLGPEVLEHYNIPKNRVTLAFGSFYDLKLEDESLDFAFMAQAFHHAAEPQRLLQEIHRVLKPGGTVIIIGEHQIYTRIAPSYDPVLGDHYYRIEEYEKMFGEEGSFSMEHVMSKPVHMDFQSFILTKT